MPFGFGNKSSSGYTPPKKGMLEKLNPMWYGPHYIRVVRYFMALIAEYESIVNPTKEELVFTSNNIYEYGIINTWPDANGKSYRLNYTKALTDDDINKLKDLLAKLKAVYDIEFLGEEKGDWGCLMYDYFIKRVESKIKLGDGGRDAEILLTREEYFGVISENLKQNISAKIKNWENATVTTLDLNGTNINYIESDLYIIFELTRDKVAMPLIKYQLGVKQPPFRDLVDKVFKTTSKFDLAYNYYKGQSGGGSQYVTVLGRRRKVIKRGRSKFVKVKGVEMSLKEAKLLEKTRKHG